MKILIAEDEKTVSDSLAAILEKGAGYEIDLAANGEEAVEKVKNNAYNLLLLDIVMPKLDGYEVLKIVRQSRPDLPVVFISGKGQASRITQSITRDKLTSFIEKPFLPEQVLEVVDTILGKKGA